MILCAPGGGRGRVNVLMKSDERIKLLLQAGAIALVAVVFPDSNALRSNLLYCA